MSFLGGSVDIDDLIAVMPGVLVDCRPVPNTAKDLTEVFDGGGVIAIATTTENASLICRSLNHCYEEWLKERQRNDEKIEEWLKERQRDDEKILGAERGMRDEKVRAAEEKFAEQMRALRAMPPPPIEQVHEQMKVQAYQSWLIKCADIALHGEWQINPEMPQWKTWYEAGCTPALAVERLWELVKEKDIPPGAER